MLPSGYRVMIGKTRQDCQLSESLTVPRTARQPKSYRLCDPHPSRLTSFFESRLPCLQIGRNIRSDPGSCREDLRTKTHLLRGHPCTRVPSAPLLLWRHQRAAGGPLPPPSPSSPQPLTVSQDSTSSRPARAHAHKLGSS